MIAELENINKFIKGKKVIQNISFSLGKGEVVALVGPNGAGKTTLLKLMANLIQADSGRIKVCNFSIQNNREQVLNNIAFMQDSSVLYSNITGYEHLQFISNIRNKSSQDIKRVIDDLGLEKFINEKVKKYSLGMKQLLLLAIAILSQPKLLLMDEPLNGLDPTNSLLLRKLIINLREQGITILFSSHILTEIDKVADRILFIQDGKIIDERKTINEGQRHISYNLKVSQPEEVIDLLAKKDFYKEVRLIGERNVLINLLEPDLRLVIKTLYDNNLEILDITKNEFNTELIYQDLYREKQ